jgi:hypothetical protein
MTAKRTGRPRMYRAADFPWLLDKATLARDAGASASEVLKSLALVLTETRSDDRKKILRAIFDLFDIAREVRWRVLMTFGIFPSHEKPKVRRSKPKKKRVRDLRRRRRGCYGVGAYETTDVGQETPA